MSLLPAPGIVLVKPIENESTLDLGETAKKGYIKKGLVLKVGDPHPTLVNGFIPAPVKEGQIIYFYTYGEVGAVDFITENNETTYFVKFDDCRGWVE